MLASGTSQGTLKHIRHTLGTTFASNNGFIIAVMSVRWMEERFENRIRKTGSYECFIYTLVHLFPLFSSFSNLMRKHSRVLYKLAPT